MASSGASAAAKNEAYVRADKIDLESLDLQLEKQLAKTWEKHKGKSVQGPREDWEIDLAKLEIRYVIAQGTYGTVYRGTYDGQDVAVKLLDWGEDGFATEAETAKLRHHLNRRLRSGMSSTIQMLQSSLVHQWVLQTLRFQPIVLAVVHALSCHQEHVVLW